METRVHVSLEVSDLDRSVAFYTALFAREPSKRKADYANFRMEGPNLHLALVQMPGRISEAAGSNRHYGIELFDDLKLAEWLKAAQAAGLEPRIEMGATCCYAVADKFWARDPDGHEWEFWVRHDEAETMHAPEAKAETPAIPKAARCCAPGAC